MTFANEKKTFLAKSDKSKKGAIDTRVIPLLGAINVHDNYYTTSSCSGRVYLWQGTGKKSETTWVRVSHDPIDLSFYDIEPQRGLVWLRLEPFILHVACIDLESAKRLVGAARPLYKKSCILSISHKCIVEIRGSEFMEMPFYQDGKELFCGDRVWLTNHINKKLEKTWLGIEKFRFIVKRLQKEK